MELRDYDELVANGLSYEQKDKYLTSGPNKYRLTKGLFWEYSYDYPDRRDLALFTLQDCSPSYFNIKQGIPRYDLKKLYLACEDHTEYEFISKFMWDEAHWEKVVKSPNIAPHIESWRSELRHKIKSQMYGVLMEDALDVSSKSRTSSAKYLLEKYLDPKTNKQLTKKQKELDNKKIAESSNTFLFEDDLARVTGSKEIN